MANLPPVMRDQRKVDTEQLRLLAIFHFVFGGLTFLGISFLFLHYTFLRAFMNPAMWKDAKGGPPPAEIFGIFKWVYIAMGVMFLAVLILNLLSGLFLQRRKHRTFSIVVAALDCIQFPFGTALGVFTLVVLFRDTVRELYES